MGIIKYAMKLVYILTFNRTVILIITICNVQVLLILILNRF